MCTPFYYVVIVFATFTVVFPYFLNKEMRYRMTSFYFKKLQLLRCKCQHFRLPQIAANVHFKAKHIVSIHPDIQRVAKVGAQ